LAIALLEQSDSSSIKDKPKLSQSFKKAVDSICRYPLPVYDRQSAIQLIGVGDFLSSRIEAILKHLQVDFSPFLNLLKQDEQRKFAFVGENEDSSTRKPKKLYVPKRGGPACALLLALNSDKSFSLQQLYNSAQLFMAERTAENEKQFWNALKKLQTETLIRKEGEGKSALFSLTEDGLKVASQLHSRQNRISKSKLTKKSDTLQQTLTAFSIKCPSLSQNNNDQNEDENVITLDRDDERTPSVSQTLSNSPKCPPLREWQIILLIDIRERRNETDRQNMLSKLSRGGVRCEFRSLSIGDFVWIARRGETEVVLDCIIERKKLSDLSQSVIDGRYAEQRERLKLTRLKRLIYLIEGSLASVHSVSLSAVATVVSSLQLCHRIMCHETSNFDFSIKFLISMNKCIIKHYSANGILYSSNNSSNHLLFGEFELYETFSNRMKKSSSEISFLTFGQQLRQIKGVSPSVAFSIINKFSSAAQLYMTYEKSLSLQSEQQMLSKLQIEKKGGKSMRSLGNSMSLRIWQFFRKLDYNSIHDEMSDNQSNQLQKHLSNIDEETAVFERQSSNTRI